MRIFIGLIEIAGYYTNLKRGFDELGVEARFVDLSGHPFGYGPSRRRGLASRCLGALRRGATAIIRSKRVLEGLHRALQTVVGLPLLAWAALRYDVFIFGYGSSLLAGYWDLPILKALGKKVICVFHGSDMRPPYIDGSQMASEGGLSLKGAVRLARRRKRALRRIERWADVLASSPPQAMFHARPFVIWPLFGPPFDAGDASDAEAPAARGEAPAGSPASAAKGRPVRILHSPSQPEVKGTPRIRRAIERLRAAGHKIDYVELSGRPHTEVLREIARCDLVVDQLYSDTFMAGLATEAAFFGKPSVVGGYAGDELRRWIDEDNRPPVLYCRPEEIESAIEKLVADADYRRDLGRRAAEHVRRRCAPRYAAECYLRIIQGDVPDAWWCDPAKIRYVHGVGLPEERAREMVRGVVRLAGAAGLQLSDKPELERMFVEFAAMTPEGD